MTIRSHFRRASILVDVVMGIFASLVATWLGFARGWLQLSVALLIAIATAFALFYALKGRFHCPRCGADLRALWRDEVRGNRDILRKKRWFWDAWDACPRCKVSFDED